MSKLVIFDMDGTLVDSRAHIVAAMTAAFAAVEQPLPARDKLLSVVGLSLTYAFEQLLPGQSVQKYDAMVHAFRAHSQGIALDAAAPLFEGVQALLHRLNDRPDVALAVATGASQRGMMAALNQNDVAACFTSLQCADHHPSKPNPSMVDACLLDCGAEVQDTIIVGDTSYDIEMAKAARCVSIGVLWGNHGRDALQAAGADLIVETIEQLEAALETIWER